MSKLLYPLFLASALLSFATQASAGSSPSHFTFQGRLLKNNGHDPVEDSAVQFNLQILSPDGMCMLYEENYTSDMTSSSGLFALVVGTGTNTHRTSLTLEQTFENSTVKTGVSCTYTPASGDIRKLRLTYDSGEGPVTLNTDQNIVSVPYAMNSSSLQGLHKEAFLQVTAQSTQVKLDSVLNVSTALTTLAAGTSNLYAKAGDLPISGGVLDLTGSGIKVPAPTAADSAVNKNYADQNLGGSSLGLSGLSDGQTLLWDNAQQKWKNVTPPSGTLTSIVAGAGLTGGTIVSSGTIALASSGVSAGTYTKLTVDTYGRVTAGASLAEADLPSLSTPGKISGSTIVNGTIGGTTAISTSGNIGAANISATTLSTQSLRLFEATNTNKINLLAPASLNADYNLTWPTALGTNGQVLSTNASGILSWTSIANPLSSLNVSAPLNLNLGSSPNTLTVTTASTAAEGVVRLATDGGVTAGQAVQANDGRLNDSRTPSGTAAGDLSGTYPNPSVAKIQSTAVSAIAPLASQVLRAGTSGWAASYLNFTDLKSAAGLSQIPSNCTASQTLVYSAGLDQFVCQTLSLSASGISGLGTAATLSVATSGDASTSQVVVGNDSRLTNARAPNGTAGGDLSGSYPNPSVAKIQGTAVSAAAPTAGQYLKYTSGAWTPAGLSTGDVPALDWSKITSGKPTTLSGYGITDSVRNEGGAPSLQEGTEVIRPAAGNAGKIYIATDSAKIYRDNGSTWDLIATSNLGTVTAVTAGTGLTGGTINGTGTLAVDVGVAANKIVQLDANARLPAVDGSQLTNLPVSVPFGNMQVFDASGTFNVPTGVTKVFVQAWGGGGGGAGGSTLLGNGGGGGGAGAYGAGFLTVTSGGTVTVTIGAGGTKGTAGNPGGNGGTSSFSTLSVTGGTGGVTNSTSFASGGTATAALAIVGGKGDIPLGGNGGGGGLSANGGPAGRGSPASNILGVDGGVPGGGGGGGAYGLAAASAGGVGGGGRIVIWY